MAMLLSFSSSQPSSTMSSFLPSAYLADLERRRALLQNVPEAPCSRPGSPDQDDTYVGGIHYDKIKKAFEAASGNTSSGKWGHVHSLVKLGCTTGRYRIYGGRIRQRENGVDSWIHPDAEPVAPPPVAQVEQQPVINAQTMHRVKEWQNTVPKELELLEHMESSQPLPAPSVPSSAGLAFPVIKRGSGSKLAATGAKAGPSKPSGPWNTPKPKAKAPAKEPKILADLSEFGFAPPSFEAISSTPNPKHGAPRAKPPPILPSSHSQDPVRLSKEAQRLLDRDERPFMSSSLPIHPSPVRLGHQQKRARSPSPDTTIKRARYTDVVAPLRSGDTPPPEDAAMRSPSPARSLGNARRIPVGEKGGQSGVLVRSRKMMKRPRPPSRTRAPTLNVTTNDGDRTPPRLSQRAFFSSPASGSEASPPPSQAHLHVANFTVNPGAFKPQGVSSQQPRGGGDAAGFGALDDDEEGEGEDPAFGLFGGGFGFNSQYDAALEVADISEFMEKDTDLYGRFSKMKQREDRDEEEELDVDSDED